jgi:hypothetical protein
MLVITLSLFWRTFLFKYGFVGVLCKNFKISFFLIVIYPIIFGIERIYRYYYLHGDNPMMNNELTCFTSGSYMTLYVLKYLIGFTYYIVMINSCYELGKAKYYKSEYWFKADIKH